MKKTEQKIVKWIQKKVKDAKAKGIVFGLSGGIDSAVVAGLVKKAVGNNHQALILPCHSSKNAASDAKKVIKQFKLKSRIVDLTVVFDCFKKTLPKGNALANANIKPRLRMITLYYIANSLNYIVAGTGNKSELLVGYYTKHGDGGVDILPIADLFKAQVVELAEQLGVPQSVVDKPPSADLWSGQTDEEEMGVKYSELDCILASITSGKKIKVSKAKVNKVKRMKKVSEHKRKMPEIFRINL
ncbi:MAG: NAD+ synthase [PVC group bacterium]|nr:NAD+ synthase [PVC group bacterium]